MKGKSSPKIDSCASHRVSRARMVKHCFQPHLHNTVFIQLCSIHGTPPPHSHTYVLRTTIKNQRNQNIFKPLFKMNSRQLIISPNKMHLKNNLFNHDILFLQHLLDRIQLCLLQMQNHIRVQHAEQGERCMPQSSLWFPCGTCKQLAIKTHPIYLCFIILAVTYCITLRCSFN